MSEINNSIFNKKNGRYALGGSTEVSAFAIEYWDRSKIDRDPSDLLYIMEKKYEGRPDLIGILFYGDPGLWWVVAQYNGIIDPLEELVEGKLLYVPLIERVRAQMFNAKKSVVATTRGA